MRERRSLSCSISSYLKTNSRSLRTVASATPTSPTRMHYPDRGLRMRRRAAEREREIERQHRFSQFPLVVRACSKNILRNRCVALSGRTVETTKNRTGNRHFRFRIIRKKNNHFMITPASLLSWFWWTRSWNARAATLSSRASWKLRTRFDHS